MQMHKKAMVIGGGIAGIQAALDLGDMGVETFLVEKGPSIGGRMAQLDKTFPTNDCAMCILSPKLVDVGSHPYINIISNAEVLSLEGSPPNLKVKVLKKPRYVDEEKCTGCGVCVDKCPINIPDPYNKGLSQTKCIHIPFPQAIPAIPIMDKEHCLYHQRGRCRVCERFCEVGAIDFEQKEQILDFEVGSIILASGTQEFDARLKDEYGYKIFPNVLTSIEFERILSASGPTGGHVTRPSDGKEPERIAILQCVGSRDVQAGNAHCSAVCCMQAAKQAIIAREHLPESETTIFYMDIRAYGKGFDRFVDRAKEEYNTRFICGRISSVEINPQTDNLIIQYNTQEGAIKQEEFDLLVLSVGLEPSESSKEAIRRLNASAGEVTETSPTGFLEVNTFQPVDTSRPGVFACGSISGPKDIPESVMEASGAASAAAAVLGELPRKEILVEYPPEKDIRGEPSEVGVFICRCGINIASIVDVPQAVEYVSHLPRVKHAQELLFACARDAQNVIKSAIEEKNLNRVVVCACTPRTHEPLFQKTLRESGINPYLFEFANIREQCSWVHQNEPEKATEKAKELARSAIARVMLAEPLYRENLEVNKDALVIGGGLAGMTAALDLADQGFQVHLVEKEEELGGNLRNVLSTLKGEETAGNLTSLIEKVRTNPKIKLYTNAKIQDITGYIGNFKTTLETPPVVRGLNPRTTGEAAFPVAKRRGEAVVQTEIEHGVVIVATGGEEYQPEEYLYGQDDRVITQRQFEEMLFQPDTSMVSSLQTVVMIQCVGSRDDERAYCSRVCCSNAIKNAIRFKEANPKANIYILFRDIRTYGLREQFYQSAREKGVLFVRYDAGIASFLATEPDVRKDGDDLIVEVDDKILGKTLTIKPDLVVLSTGIVSNPQNKVLSQLLKVPLDADGFFLEAHVKLRPVDFATDGIFVCGLAHYPKDISETIAQARAAAGRAATVLSKDTIETEAKISYVREERCSACGACVEVCAYKAIELEVVNERTGQIAAVINEALCKGCGACSATCRASAINVKGFRDEQILSALSAI